MFTVYWEYVEKARRFIRERGNSHFAEVEGMQLHAFGNIWLRPRRAYTGLKSGKVPCP